MNCGCVKNLGCFSPNQMIDFGFINPCVGDADFVFEIWSAGLFSSTTVTIGTGADVELPFTFNEDAETLIKIKLPDCMTGPGVHYATSPDGACTFSVHGVPTVCL